MAHYLQGDKKHMKGQRQRQRDRRLLLVDDDHDITFAFETILKNNGFLVETFNNPELAFSKFKEGEYDLILLDIRMPQISGFQFYEKIRKIDSKVKVCFMTAFDMHYEEFKEISPSLVSSYFIRKPVENDELVREVNAKLAEK